MGKFVNVISGTTVGLQALKVDVEINISRGLPVTRIVGLPDKSISEARERVKSAIKSCGYKYPNKRVTINLAPSDLAKTGSHFDLPIAIGIIIAEYFPFPQVLDKLKKTILIGELGLDGEIKKTRTLPILYNLVNFIDNSKMIASADAKTFLPGSNSLFGAKSINEVIEHLTKQKPLVQLSSRKFIISKNDDYSSIIIDQNIKRTIEIVCAGRHNFLMTGPPGAGKTTIAHAIGILQPSLSNTALEEQYRIYSLTSEPFSTNRPFRTPHNTISRSKLFGNSITGTPGEITLAHQGILFLDELPYFKYIDLIGINTIIDKHQTTLLTKGYHIMLPADFQLIAAMNPCKCGNLGSRVNECTCTVSELASYRKRIPSSFTDRIPIQTIVDIRPKGSEVTDIVNADELKAMQNRINNIYTIQKERKFCNSNIPTEKIGNICTLTTNANRLLKTATVRLEISNRTIIQLLKIARTIADIENHTDITEDDIAEAITYRNLK
ncbi:YifB family Mg chelatase-like AAA ATPase [Candidatus Dojkabacteria bacterium]|nr:YifB family Mg chelatase-like AAA ATPase [Candidatus Dojkabacteria bacterium]